MRLSESSPAESLPKPGPPAGYWLLPLAVALLRALPYVATRVVTPPEGTVYPPIGYNPIDTFAYVGFIRQAAETGDWFLFNPHTTLPQDGRYFLPLFSLLGGVCRWTGLSPFAALELSRVPLIFGFFAVLWRFTDGLLANRRQRVLAAMLVAFSGGVEFLAHATLDWWPTAWHRPLFEAISDDHGWSTFASLNNPLWVAGLTLALLALRPVLRPAPGSGWREAARAGGWTLVTFLVHPYSGLGVLAVGGGMLAARRVWSGLSQAESRFPGAPDSRDTGHGDSVSEAPRTVAGRAGASAGREDRGGWLILGLGLALAAIGGLSWWQNQDAVFHATARGVLGGRYISALWYPLTLGAAGWLALRGAQARLKTGMPGTGDLLVWAGVAAVLHCSPWTNGYHFVFLLHLPFCLLAAPALESALRVFAEEDAPVGRQLATATLLALAFQSALGVTWRTTNLALAYAVPAPAMVAVQALAREPSSRVYTSPHLGTILPAYTPHRVVVGHWFLTPEHSARQRRYSDLMAGRVAPADFLAELDRDGVKFALLPPGVPSGVAEALAAASRRVEPFGSYGLFHLR